MFAAKQEGHYVQSQAFSNLIATRKPTDNCMFTYHYIIIIIIIIIIIMSVTSLVWDLRF